MYETPWAVDPVKVLTRRELATVLASLNAKAATSPQAKMNRTVLRLACCAGLWDSEIAGLTLDDVRVDSTRPQIRVRPEIAMGGPGRTVPLWWDEGTFADLKEWKRERERRGARPTDAFVCCLWPKRYGSPLIRHTVRERFRTACKPLGLERLRGLTVHHGRHTFVSHALAGGPDAGRGQGRRGARLARHDVGVPARGGGRRRGAGTVVCGKWIEFQNIIRSR